jgi:VanZ family protein
MLRLITAIKPYSKFLFIAWLAVILTVSSIPSLPTLKIETEKTTIRLDYLIHFCEYGLLAFLACLSYTDSHLGINFKRLAILAAGLILIALADEFHQKFIPGRTFNLKDIYSNIAGIIAALIFCRVVTGIIDRNRG